MEFLTTTIILLTGTSIGLVAGLLPGVGNVVMLMLAYPFITDFSLFQILLFYICIAGAAQYTGSVVATTLGVPGETSSLPAVAEGHKMFLNGRGNFAISNSAIGSFVGSMLVALTLIIILPHTASLIAKFYNTHVQVIILLAVSLFLIVSYAGQRILVNVFLFGLGWFLGMIGYSKDLMTYRLDSIIDYQTFQYLHFGIPLYPLVIALFVFPIFFQNWNSKSIQLEKLSSLNDKKIVVHIKEFIKNIKSSIRGTLIGTFCGLVPHLTATLASNVSYIFEKNKRKKEKTYDPTGDLPSLVSAETANNAAGLSQLTPLLLIGIPITTSEAIILNILENNMAVVNWKTTIQSGMFNELVIWFVVMNFLCLLAAWPFAKHLHLIFKINQKVLYSLTFFVLTVLVYYLGNITEQGLYYLSVLICLLPIGYLLRKWDTLILVFAFILQGQIESGLVRLFYIHSDFFNHIPGG